MDEIKLNDEQISAIEHSKGPLLVIAGAGTGKTTVIVERIKYLILKKEILPQEILALTFTEKAAREMEERVDLALPYGYTQMWISTFHSFCDRILRDEAIHLGLDPRYKLMTEAENIQFLRQHLFEFNFNYFRPLGNPNKFLDGILNHFSRLADEDITPRQYLEWVHNKFEILDSDLKEDERIEYEKYRELAQAYQKYEELKINENVIDFAGLISCTLRLFRTRPNILKIYQEKFKYILVDEFQDTNIAQNELIKIIAGNKANLTVVADDDQSIYKWRGAAVSNVIQFRKNYPTAKIITLVKNYRSTQEILDFAHKLIQNNNPDRLEVKESICKKLLSQRRVNGKPPEFIYADRVENEADLVAQKILQLIENEKYNFSDFAILVRANNHAEVFVRALSRAGIPCQFLGPGRLFRQPEIIDIISYLKVLYNFDDFLAFYRVLAMEIFDISSRDLSAIVNYARRYNLSLFGAAEKVKDIFVSEKTKKKVEEIVNMIYRHLKLVPHETAGEIAYYFLQDSGLLKKIIDPKNTGEQKIALNLSKFFDRLKTFEAEHSDASVFAVVDWIDLSLEIGESPLASDIDGSTENAVNILTVHSAKGLEFPVVFMVNLVVGRFPTNQRREQIPIPIELIKEILPQGDYHLEEERRLFYVAMTRAKDYLFLTASDYYGEGKRERKVSPFVVECLGEEVLKKETAKNIRQLNFLDFAPTQNLVSFDSKISKPLVISSLSYSQIDTFRFCPLHYKLKYILKIPAPPTSAQSFGTTLHLVLKEFYLLLLRGEKLDENKLMEIYERNWINEGYISRSHEEKMKKRGKEYLLDYLKSDLHDVHNLPLALEQSFTFPLNEDLRIVGKIDRIDKKGDGIEIIDYKTTDFTIRNLPSKTDLEQDLQLSIYAMAATKIQDPLFPRDLSKITLSLYFLDKGIKISTHRTEEQIEKAVIEILKVKEEIEASNFACSGKIWCQDCEYKLMCNIF